MKNYYGKLCAETYEVLHAEAPEDELAFYLSYAHIRLSDIEVIHFNSLSFCLIGQRNKFSDRRSRHIDSSL